MPVRDWIGCRIRDPIRIQTGLRHRDPSRDRYFGSIDGLASEIGMTNAKERTLQSYALRKYRMGLNSLVCRCPTSQYRLGNGDTWSHQRLPRSGRTVKPTIEGKHPFGELLAQYRARKPGLTQTRLAELTGYDQAILVRMAQGKKDLTGPSGRERILRLTETLADQGALTTLDEGNGLLMAAGLPPLYERQPAEARHINGLARPPARHRTRRTNLPAALTGFVSRAQEIADARDLMGQSRLLTLTGAGGTGETRLAQRLAADVLLNYRDGVWYAELASLRDPALIPVAVANIFGWPDPTGRVSNNWLFSCANDRCCWCWTTASI